MSSTVLLILVIACGVLAFIPNGDFSQAQLVGETLNVLHFPAGAILGWWLARFWLRMGWTPAPLKILGVTFLMVGAVELTQSLVGRETDLMDAIVGGAGAIYGVLTGPATKSTWRLGRNYAVFGFSFITLTLMAPILLDWAHVARIEVHPTHISDFEWIGSDRAWKPQWGSNSFRPDVQTIRGSWAGATRALRVQIQESGWSGVAIELPRTRVKYHGIGMTVVNPEGPFRLVLKLTFADQQQGARIVEYEIFANHGINSIQLGNLRLDTDEDRGDLRSLLLYAKQTAGSRTFYVDDVIRL